ncbi:MULTISPECIES: ferredoxin [unclassified Streptomyces]|uniref:ferredoxin n=1 Tax=unclassified Streptomyces TaxID=2593676 RepID=UPI002E2BA0A5|nr:ferredoxin [Streptomyces sp. NBC_01429]
MGWNIDVDGPRCRASGLCAAMAPEHFALEDGRARPLAEEVEPHAAVLDAADSCPAMAITVTQGQREIAPRP